MLHIVLILWGEILSWSFMGDKGFKKLALKVLELIPSTYRKVTILALKLRLQSIKIIVADKPMVCA